jgi:hypothetical protein
MTVIPGAGLPVKTFARPGLNFNFAAGLVTAKCLIAIMRPDPASTTIRPAKGLVLP